MKMKGIAGKALLARKNIQSIGEAYDEFNREASEHVVGINELAAEVKQHRSDLDFSTQTLGNYVEDSSGSDNKSSSGKDEEQKPEEPTTEVPAVPFR
jgi:hypothetical protein